MQAVADTPLSQSTVAQALYLGAPLMPFTQLVALLDKALARLAGDAERPALTWDCDDIAIFRLGGLRVIMALTDAPGTDYAACISIAVGPDTLGAAGPWLRRAGGFCRLVADRLSDATSPDAVLWHRVAGVVTADTVDALVWRLCDHDLLAFALPAVELPPRSAALVLAEPVQDSIITRLARQAAVQVAVRPPAPVVRGMSGDCPPNALRAVSLTGVALALMSILRDGGLI